MIKTSITYLVLTIIAASCLANHMYAQETELNIIQSIEYRRNKLSFDLENVGYISHIPKIDLSMYSSWKRWQAYQGFNPITEEELFKLVGYKKEAEKARQYKEEAKDLILVGVLVGVAGAALTITGAIKKRTAHYDYGDVTELDPNYGLIALGSVIFSCGVGISVHGSIQLGKNWAPFVIVHDIGEEYNRKLIEQLQKRD